MEVLPNMLLLPISTTLGAFLWMRLPYLTGKAIANHLIYPAWKATGYRFR